MKSPQKHDHLHCVGNQSLWRAVYAQLSSLMSQLTIRFAGFLLFNRIKPTRNLSLDTIILVNPNTQSVYKKHVSEMAQNIMRETEAKAFAEAHETESRIEISERHLHLN